MCLYRISNGRSIIESSSQKLKLNIKAVLRLTVCKALLDQPIGEDGEDELTNLLSQH